MRTNIYINVAIILFSVFSFASTANAVLIDFDSAASGSLLTGSYSEDGFSMSRTNGHFDIICCGTGGTRYLNLDTSEDEIYGDTSVVRLEYASGLFTLTSLDIIGVPPEFGILNGSISSSNGGAESYTSPGTASFSGPEWSNISWLDFTVGPDDGFLRYWLGVDSIQVIPVPESFMISYMGFGFIILVMFFKRRKRETGRTTV